MSSKKLPNVYLYTIYKLKELFYKSMKFKKNNIEWLEYNTN